MFDIHQTNDPITYSLLDGILDLKMDMVPKLLLETVSITFLLFTFSYYYKR